MRTALKTERRDGNFRHAQAIAQNGRARRGARTDKEDVVKFVLLVAGVVLGCPWLVSSASSQSPILNDPFLSVPAPVPRPAPILSPTRPATSPAAPVDNSLSASVQRLLSDGQAALARRDFSVAEAAAREVISSRNTTSQVDGYILLGDALFGRGHFQGAAIAYDDARSLSPRGSRATEAMVGTADALIGLNNRRDACATLNELRAALPPISSPVTQRAANARLRAQC